MGGLYRDRYRDFTVQHFHEMLVAEHDFKLCYTVTRLALQTAGLVAERKPLRLHFQRDLRDLQQGEGRSLGAGGQGRSGGLAGGSSQLWHGGDLPPRVMAMPAFSKGTKGALSARFEGGDGDGPIQRGAIAEDLHGR